MDLEEEFNQLISKVVYYYNNNQLLQAEEYNYKAYKLCLKIYGNNHVKTANTLCSSAVFLLHRKQFKKSIKFFKEAENIGYSLSNTKDSVMPISYNGLAYVFKKIGDYDNSYNYFKKAIQIGKSIKDMRLPIYYCDLARIQKIKKNTEKAYETYQKSISVAKSIIKNTNPEKHKFYEQIIYYCYNDLSEIELTVNNIQQAEYFHKLALGVLEVSQSSISSFFEAYKRFEIPAKMAVYQKEFKPAIELFNKAQKAIIEEYKGFEVGKDLANIIHQIGECYSALNQNQKALSTYQNAVKAVCNDFQPKTIKDLPAIEQIYNKRSAIASLSYKAGTLLELYNEKRNQDYLLQAFQTYQLIDELLPITRRDYVEENSKFHLADETKGIYEKAIDTCLRLNQLSDDKEYLKVAFQFSESSKAIVLQEKLQADFALQGMEESVQQQDIDFRSKIAFYQSSINTNKATKGDEKQLKDWQNKLWVCKEAYERFQQKIEQENPSYYAVKYAQSISTIEKLQDELQANTALIEYFKGADNLYTFVITKNTYTVHQANMCSQQQLADMQLVKKLIHQFNKRGNLVDYESFKILGYKLYQKLLEPALKGLDKSLSRLTIIPDGLLYHISFEALLTSEKNHNPSAYYHPKNLDYVCKKYSLSYYYSASLLLNANNFKSAAYTHSFSCFAPKLEDLQHNQKEATQVNNCFEGALFLEDAANIDNFKITATQSKIIHLATHAKCNDENSKLSRIQFNDEKYIGNSAIENMKISCSLMVLSACETGAGLIQSGEGAMSLARSVYLAGCPSLVASLWRANDKSTAKIMLYFYQHLKNGATKDVALQQAKLKYCEESGLRESHPFYWAGFVQYGNRRSLF